MVIKRQVLYISSPRGELRLLSDLILIDGDKETGIIYLQPPGDMTKTYLYMDKYSMDISIISGLTW